MPASRTARVGEAVRWEWRGRNLHNVTFDQGASATQTAGSFERSFGAAGSYNYLCTIHGQVMSGTITVTP